MQQNVLFFLLTNVSLLFLVATLVTEIRPLRNMLKKNAGSAQSQIVLGLIFGSIAIAGTYTGLEFQGAVVNTRVISTLCAGLIGGPWCGLIAGLVSGIQRAFYYPEGFTTIACAIGTFIFGVIGAIARKPFSRCRRKYLALVGLVVLSEAIQAAIILLISKPFEAAVELERSILIPKMLMNSIGAIAFVSMFSRLNRNLSLEMAEQQSKALAVAQKCFPYLSRGIRDKEAVKKAADIVAESFEQMKVIISDTDKVIAFGGKPQTELPLPGPALKAMQTLSTQVVKDYKEPGGYEKFSDSAAIAVPLVWENDEVVGSMTVVVPMGPNDIIEADMQTAESLGDLFASMLRLGELQHQIDLRKQAEFRALQSQINPHFLFNALTTISALCLVDAERAREMILVLATYFRQMLSINEPFVTLDKELENVENYLLLTEARFEGALHVTKEYPENRRLLRLPPLILQPLVENAVRHGGVGVDDRRVAITITQDEDRAYITVSDEGRGMPEDIIKELDDPESPRYSGLFNVRKRLRSVYGDLCSFNIDSSENGCTVSLSLPLTPPGAE